MERDVVAAPHGDAPPPDAFSRRGFLKLLGGSAALATFEACRPPRAKIVPYVTNPSNVTPSIANRYATAASVFGYGVGLVVTSWEGKPSKVEGNPDHPASLGGTDAQLQAEVLNLYDPARMEGFRRGGRALSIDGVVSELWAIARDHEKDGGARLRLLLEPTSSPTLLEYRARVLKRFPNARLVTWSPASDDPSRSGAEIAFGRPLEPLYRLREADVVLALDADFLVREGEPLRQAREFAGRREGEKMNRLYVAESDFTVTGGVADHRLRMRGQEVLPFARAVAQRLSLDHGLKSLSPLGADATEHFARAAAAVAKDLANARGRSLVIAGMRQPPALHALCAALNEALSNVDATVSYYVPVVPDTDRGNARLKALADELKAGKVDTLFVTAFNPNYSAPADLDFRSAFAKAKESVVLSLYEDETARAANFRLGALHALESWGDLRSRDGTTTIVQPLISPLLEGTTELELLASLLGEGGKAAHNMVRDGWRIRGGFPPALLPSGGSGAAPGGVNNDLPHPPDPFDRAWETWLSAGLLEKSASRFEATKVDLVRVAQAVTAVPPPGAGFEVGVALDYRVLDGRFVNNAWLEELPHAVTKLTWDNAVHLSPKTAKRLGISDGDLVEVSKEGRKVEGPAQIVLGHADEAATIALGYGQPVNGPVAAGAGFDAYPLRTLKAAWLGEGEVRKKGGRADLAIAQGHFSMEGRKIALSTTLGKLEEEKPELLRLRQNEPSIQPQIDYSKQEYAWGMAIDLSRCIGCAACTAACQAENNIPIVGKKQVMRSREMHWIRVDRYFEGSPEEPESVTQPLACQQCELAPCEYVCPVNATVHSEDGLNVMAYNRCVGTRYCSNNCPYKVRRFNYLDYHGEVPQRLKMLMNPDVTVRSRGVMEKCNYCIQRIERARIDARVAGRKIGPDEVVPACAQACSTEAITFGNLNDPASAVAKKHLDVRRYDLLHELGTRPRTAYLIRLKNPNPDLA